jgi:hypothetical protein
MSRPIQDHQWIYVVVQDPGKDEQYLGQHDTADDISFIPIFLEKEHALMCLNLLAKDSSRKYEVQAVMFDHLAGHAREGGFMLYVLNEQGVIAERISP